MAASEPPRLTIVQPGAGPTGVLGSIGVGFQLWGEDTGGALSIVEHPFPVGALVGAHLHTREDEYSIVTEGEIGFRSGEREVVLGSGGYITKPRGEMHAMWNAGTVPARMIEIISPRASNTSSANSPKWSAQVQRTSTRCQSWQTVTACASATPTGFPGVITRYRLTPPPTDRSRWITESGGK
jgi:mannose-6-phosphate isomerase-like protein (cupin superfamily)